MDGFKIEPDPSFAFVRTELVREVAVAECPHMGTSRDVADYARRELLARYTDKEAFWALLLDGKHRLMAANLVSVGTLTASLVHPREVYRPAIAQGACAIILVHNHPSGDPDPSPQDLALTERLVAAGALLDIRILDHVIVGRGRYTSLRDAGLWPSTPVKSIRSVGFEC